MKKFMTLLFSSMLVFSLAMPVFAQDAPAPDAKPAKKEKKAKKEKAAKKEKKAKKDKMAPAAEPK